MAHSQLVADAGTIPFSVLELLGREASDLPGAWVEAPEPHPTVGSARLLHRARGEADGRPLGIEVLARVQRGRVWAVGLRVDGYVVRVGIPATGEPYLAAVPYPPSVPRGLVNWISERDGTPYDVGLAP